MDKPVSSSNAWFAKDGIFVAMAVVWVALAYKMIWVDCSSDYPSSQKCGPPSLSEVKGRLQTLRVRILRFLEEAFCHFEKRVLSFFLGLS